MATPLSIADESTFIKYEDFELSTRGKIDEKRIKSKLEAKEIPLIIDISINGYSNKVEFDIEVKDIKFSEFKKKCLTKVKDGESLTVKRACRVCRVETNEYIKRRKIITPLFKQYSIETKASINVNEYAFIGGEHLVPSTLSRDLYNLWVKFDQVKNTTISVSVKRVLEARLGLKVFE